MTNISLWGFEIPVEWLSEFEVNYLRELPPNLPTVEWVCNELDRIWYEFNLDNTCRLDNQRIGDFYAHPVWLMNGVFSARDPISFAHRSAIAQYIKAMGLKLVADYGGGFGELARRIAHSNTEVRVHLVEPYPSKVGLERLRIETQVEIVPKLTVGKYEAIVAQDVLEHVEDPIKLASEIASGVCIGGKVIFANCFYPLIQCHLPTTFHLRYTFKYVMMSLGLRYIGKVDGVAHAQIFERVGPLSLNSARRIEKYSKLLGPALNSAFNPLSRMKLRIKKIVNNARGI